MTERQKFVCVVHFEDMNSQVQSLTLGAVGILLASSVLTKVTGIEVQIDQYVIRFAPSDADKIQLI